MLLGADGLPVVDKLTADVLPESRMAPRAKGAIGSVQSKAGTQVPIFCASCGASGGYVPEAHCTFAFYLCNPCFATYGELTNTMVTSDEQFWALVLAEQEDVHGRVLAPAELAEVVAADTSALSRLINAGS